MDGSFFVDEVASDRAVKRNITKRRAGIKWVDGRRKPKEQGYIQLTVIETAPFQLV